MAKTRTAKKRSRSRGRHRGVQSRATPISTPTSSPWICSTNAGVALTETVLNKGWRERRAERDSLKRDARTAATEQEVLKHARALGLDAVETYKAWCVEHRLSDFLHKSPRQRHKELALHREEASRQALHRVRRLTRRPRDTITAPLRR